MRRPLPLRLLPDRLRTVVAWLVYRPRRERWLPLYSGAALRFAPGCRMDLVPGDVLSDHIAFTGIWDLRLSRHVVALAGRGGVMVEVGANLGYFSLLWAAARAGNRCVAFEASPRVLPLLRRNVALNRFGDGIDVHATAAGRASGRATFDLGPADQTGWGGLAGASAAGQVEVPVVRVDEVVTGAEPIALLKVDAEGADAWVLEGCRGLLESGRIREVWFEQNRPRMRALGIAEDAAARFLDAVGYAVRPAGPSAGDISEWRAVHRAAAD